MELQAFDAVFLVPNAHDEAVACLRRNDKALGAGFPVNDQAVVSRGSKRIGNAGEQLFAIVNDFRYFPVHEVRRPDNGTAERISDGLRPPKA